jgi:hypothetical protein
LFCFFYCHIITLSRLNCVPLFGTERYKYRWLNYNSFINKGNETTLIAGESQVLKLCYIKQEKSERVISRWSAVHYRSTVLFPLVCNSWWHLHYSEDQTYSNFWLKVQYPPHTQHSAFPL